MLVHSMPRWTSLRLHAAIYRISSSWRNSDPHLLRTWSKLEVSQLMLEVSITKGHLAFHHVTVQQLQSLRLSKAAGAATQVAKHSLCCLQLLCKLALTDPVIISETMTWCAFSSMRV